MDQAEKSGLHSWVLQTRKSTRLDSIDPVRTLVADQSTEATSEAGLTRLKGILADQLTAAGMDPPNFG